MTDDEVTKYIFVEDHDQRGDIAFVFGTWNAYKESCQKAAELYKTGLVPKIIVSGGINKKTGSIEGDAMALEIIKFGVPKEDILIENKSSNTLENVTFSRGIVDREIGLHSIKTIVAVVKNAHARRALMTLKKHMPEHIRLKSAPYQSAYYDNINKNNWSKSEIGRRFVLSEVEKIKKYLAQGHLTELL